MSSEKMSEEEKKHYGTFQGGPGYPNPSIGFQGGPSSQPYYSHGYQVVPGYAVAEGSPIRERRLPCCGLGFGWFLFIIGFFLGGIPWYCGAIILLCARVDHREKPGYVACVIGAVLAAIATVLGVTKAADS